ncbi:hypothetical protein [Nonlabens xiamenensis]|uniref:hypothetical protein n=1 Tax=Nonlabens xiamenensis TaxID=2341043 RepID=UPI000F614B8B|nr:hypothetical protein [Nonlabens xiamenensis]
MKKLLFIAALLMGATAMAQQEITPQQKQHTLETETRLETLNEKVNSLTDQIISITQLDLKKKGSLLEVVEQRVAALQELHADNSAVQDKQGMENDINNRYELQLKEVLGEEKFQRYMNNISPK